MMKKFFISIIAAVLTLGASAQLAPKTFDGALVKNPESAAKALNVVSSPRKALAQNQQYMGAYTSDDYVTNGLGLTGLPGTYDMGAVIPTNLLLAYDGGKVVGMRFAVAQAANTSHCYIGYYNNNTGEMTTLAEAKVSNSKTGWNTYMFDEPFTLDLSAYQYLMMGFDYKQTSTNYPLAYSTDGTPCVTLLYGDLGDGMGWYDIGFSTFGNLCVQAIVEKDFAPVSIGASTFEDAYAQIDCEGVATLTLVNGGTEGVADFDYTITKDGQTSAEQHYVLDEPCTVFGGAFKVKIPFTGEAEACTKEVAITITKVNGQDNPAENNVALGRFITLKKLFTKRVVEEEFTGTGCGWCPRGLQGLENSRQEFGDRFIGIAIHQYSGQSTDAMYIATNSYAKLGFTGAPSCYLDRTGDTIDPYYGSSNSISDDIEEMLSKVAEVGVEINAYWTDDDKKSVDATATVEAVVEDNEYSIEFVLIADGLKGSGAGWNQQNYYAQYAADPSEPDLAKFCKGGEWGKSTLTGWVFNDIAIASSYRSNKNMAPELGTLAAYDPVEVSFTINMPTYTKLVTAIKEADYDVYAAALVINKATGVIANAAKVKVTDMTTGISTATTTPATNAAYNLAGQRVADGFRGIVIKDGKKFMVK